MHYIQSLQEYSLTVTTVVIYRLNQQLIIIQL